MKLIIALVACLAIVGCSKKDEPQPVRVGIALGANDKTDLDSEANGRFRLETRSQITVEKNMQTGEKGFVRHQLFVLTDTQSGKEFVGIAGVGMAELKR